MGAEANTRPIYGGDEKVELGEEGSSFPQEVGFIHSFPRVIHILEG